MDRPPILLTGATGFIGREIARRLLDASRPIVVLARRRDGVEAADRVAAALGDRLGSLEVVEGDIAAAGGGLAEADCARLRECVETVIHCAGDTSFAPASPTAFVAGHIHGPVTLLRALAGRRLARWIQVSTAYVCGTREGLVLESDGDRGQAFHNDYERVKLRAESAVRETGASSGVDVRVLRPSIVVGAAPATGGGTPSNLFFVFIRLVATLAHWPSGAGRRLRLPGAPRAAFNIVPVEYVAMAAIALAEHPAAGGTFHLVVRDAPDQATMLAMICERLGVRGPTLFDTAAWPPADLSPLERRVARMLEPYRAYLGQNVRFDDQAARAVLARCGISRPQIAPADVGHLVDLAVATEALTPQATP